MISIVIVIRIVVAFSAVVGLIWLTMDDFKQRKIKRIEEEKRLERKENESEKKV